MILISSSFNNSNGVACDQFVKSLPVVRLGNCRGALSAQDDFSYTVHDGVHASVGGLYIGVPIELLPVHERSRLF